MKKILLLILVFLGIGNAFGQYSGTGTFTKVTTLAGLTDGYYVITDQDSEKLMTNGRSGAVASGYFLSGTVTLTSGNIVNPVAANVWKIATNPNGGKTIYNEAIAKYVGWGSGNGASIEDAVAATSRWTFTYTTDRFTVNNVATATRQLSHNPGATRFAAYDNALQDELQFYKLSGPEINLQGAGANILSGATGVSTTNNTNFGNADVTSGTVAKTFTIQNTGSAALSLSGTPRVAISGTHAADFTVTTQPSTASVAASGNTTFIVTFDPNASGARNATVSIANNDSDENPYTFAIQGTGVNPATVVSVTALANLDYVLGSGPSAYKTFNVSGTNLTANLVVTPPSSNYEIATTATGTYSSAAISLTPASGSVSSTPIYVKLKAGLAVGNYTTEVISVTSTNVTTKTVTLSGSVTAPSAEINIKGDNNTSITSGDTTPAVADGTDFGATSINTIVTKTYTIENTGLSDLVLPLTDAVILLSGNTGFTVTQPLITTIASGASTTFTVSFNSATTGTFTDNVMISSNDSDESTYDFAIKAVATDIPENPDGTISGATPACDATTLTYTGTIPNGVTYYWQAIASGISTDNNAASPLQVTASGNYFVRAFKNGTWSTGATVAYTIVINQSIALTAQPDNQPVGICPASSFAALSVTATGTAPTYQWYKSTDNSNATAADDVTVGTNLRTFTPPVETGTFYYYVVVSGTAPCASVKSAVSGARTVHPKPATPQGTITPTSSCGTATLAYNYAPGEDADGNTYYWQTVSGGQSVSNPVSSPTTQTITGIRYIRSLSSVGCWSDEISQNITVTTPVNITTEPNSTSVVIPASKTFTVVATGTAPLTYQWQLSTNGGAAWENITNATSASYATGATSEGMNGYRYKCLVTNSCGTATSATGILTLTNAAPNNGLNLNQKVCYGNTTVDLTWTASSSTGTISYIVFANPIAVPFVSNAASAGNAIDYVANSDFSLAIDYLPLGKAVYKGSGTAVTVTGLTPGASYNYKVVAYKGEAVTGWAAGITTDNTTSSWIVANAIAKVPEVTNLAATAATTSSSISWAVVPASAGCYEYMVVANQGAVTFVPSGDGSAYTASTIYAGGNQVLYKGTGNSTGITALTEDLSYCYKVFVRKGTEWSEGVSVCRTTALTYCSSAGSTDSRGITAVNFNTISQTSASNVAYTDYTATAATTLQLGENYPLTINVNTNGNSTVFTRAWIDWDRSGTFDSGELYETGLATNVASGLTSLSPLTITVPTDAFLGTVRMRISAKLSSSPTSCEAITSGEVEDYTINITRPTGPEIVIKGSNITIPSGSTATTALNQTLFGLQELRTPSAAKEYAVYSIGTASLDLTGTPAVQITGANASDFSVTEQPSTSIAATGGTTVFKIAFTPSAPGLRTAIVSIASTDANENPYTFTIQGTGKSPEIDVRGNGISIPSGNGVVSDANNTLFGTVQVTGGLATKTFSIVNTGTDILTLSNPLLSGSSDFTITANPAASVAINGTTSFTVAFNPSSTGEKNAIVVIGNNDFNENPYTFTIQGNGVDYIECGVGAEEIIVQQNFEVTPATPVWAYTNPAAGTFSVRGEDQYVGDDEVPTYLGAQSFQVYNNASGTILRFNAVNTSSLTDVNLNFKVAAFSRNNATNGMDAGDNLSVEVSTDGATWSREIQINGFSNATWSFTSGSATANKAYTGNSTQAFAPSAGGSRTTDGYSTVNLTNLPRVENLYIRIILLNDATSELWAVDNVILKAKRKAVKTWSAGNWRNAANAIATAPTATEEVIINGNYSTALGNLLGCKCQINPGFTLTVASDTYMIIQNEVKNDGSIIIENNGSLVQKNDFAVNSGQITYKRITPEITRYDYIYWSSPVAGFSLHDVSPNTLSDKYFSWDKAAQDWHLETNGAVTMEKGAGYIARGSQSFTTAFTANQRINATFEGIPNNGEVKLTGVGAGQANFLGNPYPSAIDARLFLNPVINPNLEGTIYLWTHNTEPALNPENGHYQYTANDYAVYNLSGSTVTRSGAEELEDYIAAGQGFFADGASQGPIVFNNSMRVAGNNGQFLRNQNAQQQNEPARNRIWLNLKNSQDGFSQAMVGYIENATNSYDRFYDGKVFGGTSVNLYSLNDNIDLTIQARALPFDKNDKIDLGYRATLAGIHTISIDHFDGLFTGNQEIYLEDKLLNVIYNLKNSAYTFTTTVGTFNDRFVLRYTSETLGNPDFDTIKNAVIVSVKNRSITVNSSLENIKGITVYDLLGRVIYDNNKVNAKDFTIQEANASQQALVVKILLDNGMETSRKIILN